ncbi:hypothetical protein [Thiopseudomonas denitrificans]|uniref:hypothetical protein n=1 Tax=Thiopseudomonas denitrificans TaxID=1501432 RepID=UPI00105B8DF5|nr:hypothetical protein [Thiopseudomonas denitrificans]
MAAEKIFIEYVFDPVALVLQGLRACLGGFQARFSRRFLHVFGTGKKAGTAVAVLLTGLSETGDPEPDLL